MSDLNSCWRDYWDISRDYCFNHGSMGVTPKAVLDKQEVLYRQVNASREEFIREGGFRQIEKARTALADFVGSQRDNLVLTTNITESINSVIKSLIFAEVDEVLVTNHIYVNYPALLEECALRQGFKLVRADIPYRINEESQILDAIEDAITTNTKLAIIDHISSPTAMIFPIKKIVDMLSARGIDCFIDGAHAPGQLPLDLENLGAAYYGANNHKWLCAPLSSGFLYARPDRQAMIIPAVGSGYASRENSFVERFSWQGVIDFVPRVMITDTLKDIEALHPRGWNGIYKRNHELAVAARDLMAEYLGIEKPVPDEMIGAMFTLPLGQMQFTPAEIEKAPLRRGYDYMVENYGFGVIFSQFDDEYLVRVTCHLYNKLDEYKVLAEALARFQESHK